MFRFLQISSFRPAPLFFSFALACSSAFASGPKSVAGTSYFNPASLGQPIHWKNGQLNYFVDQGPLSATVTNQQATAMVDAAAALWSAVPTAAVTLTNKGPLNEDVSGANISVTNSIITAPSDITPSATSYPVAVIYDYDGSVIDAIYGTGTSKPDTCQLNGVFTSLDNYNPDATAAHGIILLNGLCATNSDMLEMMSFQLERAFGRILGLDSSQVTPNALTDEIAGGTDGWPIMQPISGVCSPAGGACIPNPTVLRPDDMAALNRIYPITPQNLASFPDKRLTSSTTVSIQGTISFHTGYGMQGVNVVARPLDSSGNPLYQYTVTAVSGAYFSGNHGNPISGFNDANGNPLTRFGSDDPTLQGFFDLSDIPLPPGSVRANYQITFEPLNPLYINSASVGPYIDGQTSPSGTLAPIAVPALAAGTSTTLTVNVEDSAVGGYQDAIGTQAQPRPMPASGLWAGRLSQIGQSDWFNFPVRANRSFTVVTQALDESGAPTESKAMPSIGVWDAFDAVGSAALGAAPGMNGLAKGETWLRITSQGDTIVRIGIADQRGDGRPDYPYNGWLLYADTVTPQRLPAAGGPIVIHGMGFRSADTVLVGGQPAIVTSISPNEITAIAPPAPTGVTGSVDVEVDDQPLFYAAAIAIGGISYDSGTGDALTLNTAPMNTVPLGVPIPFAVTALGPDLTPAGNVTVLYTVTSGTAILACGQPVCSVTATGDGHATMNVTATDGTWSIVTASLTNGSQLKAEFAGGTPPVLASLTPRLSLAAGASTTWTVQAQVLSRGLPAAGQSVSFQSPTKGIAALGSAAALTNTSGIATYQLSVGPLAEGAEATINACLNGTSQCITFTALGARTEYAQLAPVSGTPSQVTLRLLDMDNVPMAGGTATFYQSLYAWTPPCNAHSACTPGALLSTQAATATSDINGLVTFTPATLPGVATTLVGIAASGNSATVNIAVEQHP